MHWTTHVATGAAWGYLIESPLPAAMVGVGGHLVMDALPHHDPEADLGYVIDGALGTAFLAFLLRSRRKRGADTRGGALWGAVGSALPDTELLVKLFKDIRDEEYLFPSHNGRLPHSSTGPWASTISQGAIVAFSLALCAVKVHRNRLRSASVSGEPAG